MSGRIIAILAQGCSSRDAVERCSNSGAADLNQPDEVMEDKSMFKIFKFRLDPTPPPPPPPQHHLRAAVDPPSERSRDGDIKTV